MKKLNAFTRKITVFTPTFNRSHTLERLYRSLQRQTFTDFEWLVIDDGSTDGTRLLFEEWSTEENPFPIHYHSQVNGGKHTAINLGLDKAKGELFFTADSDDYLTDDALEKVNKWANSLPINKNFCGVVGNWGYTESETPNTIFEGKWRDASLLERYPECSEKPIDGERAWVFFTDIHRKYKYPVFENEKFMTEAVAWNRMAKDGYKMRIFNDIIYIYKYLPDGLTLSGSKMFIENPKGYGLWLKEKMKFSNSTNIQQWKIMYSYVCSQIGRLSKKDISHNIGSTTWKISLLSYFYALKKMFS